MRKVLFFSLVSLLFLFGCEKSDSDSGISTNLEIKLTKDGFPLKGYSIGLYGEDSTVIETLITDSFGLVKFTGIEDKLKIHKNDSSSFYYVTLTSEYFSMFYTIKEGDNKREYKYSEPKPSIADLICAKVWSLSSYETSDTIFYMPNDDVKYMYFTFYKDGNYKFEQDLKGEILNEMNRWSLNGAVLRLETNDTFDNFTLIEISNDILKLQFNSTEKIIMVFKPKNN